MDRTFLEARATTPNQAQLWIWIKAAMTDATAQKTIAPSKDHAASKIGELAFVLSKEGQQKELSHSWTYFLIRVQTQNPIPHRLIDRRILLRGVAFPFLNE